MPQQGLLAGHKGSESGIHDAGKILRQKLLFYKCHTQKKTKNKLTQKQPPHQSNLWRQRRRGNVFAVLRLKGGNDQVQVLDDPNIYTSVSRPVKTTFSAKTKT